MRDGDLSNDIAPGIGMRFEGVIKTDEGKLNRAAKAYLLSISRLDVNVFIITTGDTRRCMAFCLKWGVPYYRVIDASSIHEIPTIVREMNLLTYYDSEKTILQNVNSRGHGNIEVKEWTSITL